MKFKLISFIAAAAIVSAACTNDWLEEYKLDQNRPSDVGLNVLLPSAQASYGMVQGDVLPRLTSIVMQQMTGTDRQSLAHNRYAGISEGDFDTPWNNSYSLGMYDLQLILNKAGDEEKAYTGIAKIMMAMYLGILTDHFGDIPYSDALQGAANLIPEYDSQQDIYASILALLEDGKADLVTPGTLLPTTDDIIHGGDLGAWIATADGLIARHLNHLSETSNYSPTNVIAACELALAGNVYSTLGYESASNQNPWHQFTVIGREGYITQYGTMYDMMTASSDPRIPFYRSADSMHLPSYGSATSELLLMTAFEVLFIKAEAQMSNGDASGARTSLEAAIDGHMTWLGVHDTLITAYVAALPANTDEELIMNEKYVAMFTSAEAWTDWRRTGFPNISAPSGANVSDIPRRMPYPEAEYLYNAANVPMPMDASLEEKFGVDATYRLWWDK
tara:strand:+ start:541 stop:1881 length:1341 start_codon:yes stop_codon:yes gene_type:complete